MFRNMLERLRATPWHVWLSILLGVAGLYLAYTLWRNHSGSGSATPGASGGTPDWQSLGANESALQGELAALASYLNHPQAPPQPTSAAPTRVTGHPIVQPVHSGPVSAGSASQLSQATKPASPRVILGSVAGVVSGIIRRPLPNTSLGRTAGAHLGASVSSGMPSGYRM